MTHVCYEPGCTATETEYIDATAGPVGDFRYYCPVHMHKFKRKEKIRRLHRSIAFNISEIELYNIKIQERTIELLNQTKALKKLTR